MDKSVIPDTECLRDAYERLLPFWNNEIVQAIKVSEMPQSRSKVSRCYAATSPYTSGHVVMLISPCQASDVKIRASCYPFVFHSIKEGNRVLVVAHGSTLRALIKYLDRIPDEEIVSINIPPCKFILFILFTTTKLAGVISGGVCAGEAGCSVIVG